MTSDILRSVRCKQEISITFKKYPSNVNITSYYTKYKNNLTSLLKKFKIEFYKKKFANFLYSPKLAWKVIR